MWKPLKTGERGKYAAPRLSYADFSPPGAVTDSFPAHRSLHSIKTAVLSIYDVCGMEQALLEFVRHNRRCEPVKDKQKSQEVQFYLDRSIDSAVMIMRSILENPRLSVADRIDALSQIANHHSSLALMLQTRLYGEDVVIGLNKEP
jgi:hypothetical protein